MYIAIIFRLFKTKLVNVRISFGFTRSDILTKLFYNFTSIGNIAALFDFYLAIDR